ncbi:MAG: hypothetical protein GX444_15825 [Myxococcales bacterium]|nr:hypothetical protein [Myxococcales bacterium]
MKRIISWLICAIGLLLPWRWRVFYARLIGATMQALYGIIFLLTRFLIRQLRYPDGKK